jgi:hypothetical protein
MILYIGDIMGKAKRKINRLKRKLIKKGVKIRIPIAPPQKSMKTKKDYDRKKHKQETKKIVNNEG